MDRRLQKEQLKRIEKIERIIDYVQANKDTTASRRMIATVLDSHEAGRDRETFAEFISRVGRAGEDTLDRLMDMMEDPDFSGYDDITSRRETDFPR